MPPLTAPADTPRWRLLLALAWPIVVSRSSQVVIGFCDAAMAGQLGEAALAATTTGALNCFSLFILPMGIVFIVSSFVSQHTGQNDVAAARRYGWYGLLVAVAAQVVSLLGIPLVPAAVGLFGYAPDVSALLVEYMVWRLVSGGAAIGTEALANYYGGLGNTRLPMLANLLAMALNVVFNWLLIFGHAGFPAMGVAGAALASTLATVAAFVLLLVAFYVGVGTPRAPKVRLDAGEFLRMLRFGLPSGFNWFFEMAAFTFFVNVVIVDLGTTALAGMMAVMQVNSVSFMPAFGLASAGAIMVGQLIGAKRTDEVPGMVVTCVKVVAAWQVLVGALYVALPELLMQPFVADASQVELVQVGAYMLSICGLWQVFDALANTLAEALRAAGDTAFCLWARVALAWLVFVPMSLWTVRYLHGGVTAAMLCLVFYIASLAAILLLRFRHGAWRHINLIAAVSP